MLDVLAGRKTQGTISGEIAFSNHPPTRMFLRRYTGYVEQFDTLLGMLTVKEMLMYTAELKVHMTTHLCIACLLLFTLRSETCVGIPRKQGDRSRQID